MKLLKIGTLLSSLVVLFFSCSDSESEQILDLKGTIKGKISLVTEMGQLETIQSGATLSLQVDGKKVDVTSGEKGEFELSQIPFGTYDLVCEKSGFSTYNLRSYRVAGGTEPQFLSFSLIRPATSKVTELTIVQGSATTITIKGNFTGVSTGSSLTSYPIILFTGNSPDVSSSKYLRTLSVYTSASPNLNWTTTLDKKTFPSGTTLYAVAHTLPPYYYYASFNPLTASFEYGGLSITPSNTASIKVQ